MLTWTEMDRSGKQVNQRQLPSGADVGQANWMPSVAVKALTVVTLR
jgi:hypothetical protein